MDLDTEVERWLQSAGGTRRELNDDGSRLTERLCAAGSAMLAQAQHGGSTDDLKAAKQLFEKALRIDETSAAALAGIKVASASMSAIGLSIKIPRTHMRQDVATGSRTTRYEVDSSVGFTSWTVQRTFSEFSELKKQLQKAHGSKKLADAHFPSSHKPSLLTDQNSLEVVQDRISKLAKWIQQVAVTPDVGGCRIFLDWLETPDDARAAPALQAVGGDAVASQLRAPQRQRSTPTNLGTPRAPGMALASSIGNGRLQDRIEDALAPDCQSAATIADLLVEIDGTGYSHPTVNSLRQKHSRLQTTLTQSFNSTTEDSAAHSAANAEDQWRRRSVQASANFFLQSGGSAKVCTPTLASFGEDEGEESEDEEGEEKEQQQLEERQQDIAIYASPGAAGSHTLLLALRVAGHATPATLRVLNATGLLDVQRAIAEFLNLSLPSPDEIATIKLFALDPDFGEEVRVTSLGELRETFADCEIIPRDGATDKPFGMGTHGARAMPSSEEGIPPQQTPIGNTVHIEPTAAPHRPPSKVVSLQSQLSARSNHHALRCNELRWHVPAALHKGLETLILFFSVFGGAPHHSRCVRSRMR